ncbi:hypothetical protein D3C76_882390 [compost metagenome]
MAALISARSVGLMRMRAQAVRSATVGLQPFSATSSMKSPTVRLWKLYASDCVFSVAISCSGAWSDQSLNSST